MDRMTLLVLLFHAIPEGMLSGSVGLSIVAVRPTLGKIFAFGTLFAVTLFFLRRTALPPGVHSVVSLFFNILYLWFIFRISPLKAVFAAILGFAFIVLGETLCIPIILAVTDLTIDQIMQDQWLRIIATLPQQLFLLLVFLTVYHLRGYHRKDYNSTFTGV